MGKFILVKSDEVIPSQDFLKEATLGFILDCYTNHNEDKLPPPPIVRLDLSRKNYIAIDGHNLLMINGLLGKPTNVFVAGSKNDCITLELSPSSSQESLLQRNADLQEKFDSCLLNLKDLKEKGILSFNDLQSRYSFLKDIDTANDYFKNKK